MRLLIKADLALYVPCGFEAHLSKEGHSEVRPQQPLAAVHHLHHFRVGPVERVVQVGQFLLNRFSKQTITANNQVPTSNQFP